ncbi:hypothetical protein KLP28_05725 [Nocardioidaceae bacterium]|nr:hypothetical protein KLP28_05725 [Nocardioidaceae bacterium]
MTASRSGPPVVAAVWVLTVLQLAAAVFVDLPQFEGKAFGSRLVLYPLMMLVAPVLWWVFRGRRGAGGARPVPWLAFGLVMAPFLVDVTGNTLDLYDAVSWWDDANHLVNWALLLAGIGLLVARDVRPRWVQVALVTGLGALLAIGWEIGEYYAFIRGGTELDGAYEDTLGDEVLGSLGALVAGSWLAWRTKTTDAGNNHPARTVDPR